MKKIIDVVVIGGGPAGLSAAVSAYEQGASVLLLERDHELGGILNQCIHNGFGLQYFKEELTGPEYAHKFIEKVQSCDIEIMLDTFVLRIDKTSGVHAVSATHGLVEIQAGAIVLAMGCRERTRGALSLPGTRPAGVYTAGCAQYLVNIENYMPGNRVVVLGSGDIGMIMARRMVWEGAKVDMVCELMPYSSGLNRNIVQCLQDNNIPLLFSTTVVRIHGAERLEGVTIAKVDEHLQPIQGTELFVPCDTLLLSVGLIPENELTTQADIALDPLTSGALVDQARETTAPGIFACGNVLHVHDLVDNVSYESIIAGASAASYAKGARHDHANTYAVVPGDGVRYAVPQRIEQDTTGKIDIYFRVDAAYKPAKLTVLSNDKKLISKKATIMTPGEMEKITIDMSDVAGAIVLSVES